MIVSAEKTVQINGEADIVAARQLARQTAVALGFSAMDQSRVATAVSELARNVVRYALGSEGTVHVREVESDQDRGIEVVVEDAGPGIPDIGRAMQQGYSSGNGLGLGLGGTQRLMDEMHIESSEGAGTTVTIRKWLR